MKPSILKFICLITLLFCLVATRVSTGWFEIKEVNVTEFGRVSVIPQNITIQGYNQLWMREGSSGQTKAGVERSLSSIPAPCILKFSVARSFSERLISASLVDKTLAEAARYEVHQNLNYPTNFRLSITT